MSGLAALHLERALDMHKHACNTREDDALILLILACGEYAAALQENPNMHGALFGWGMALAGLAKASVGESSDHFYQLACEKFSSAHAVDSHHPEVLYNWAKTLMDWAASKPGGVDTELYFKAEEILKDAAEFSDGQCMYLLAQLYALQDKSEDCREWMVRTRDSGFFNGADPNVVDLEPNLKPVRDTDWFREFITDLQ